MEFSLFTCDLGTMMTSAKECRHYNDRETFILALRLFKFIKFIFNITKEENLHTAPSLDKQC